MARTVELQELRTRILELTDKRSIRFPNTVLNDWINEAITMLQDLILSENKEYNLTSTDINLVSGTATYALPADFYKGFGVDVLLTNNRYATLERFNWNERNFTGDSVSNRASLRYRFQTNDLVFESPPGWTATGGIRLWYIPVLADLSGDTDTYDGIHGWDNYVVLYVSIWVRESDEEDITGLSALLGKMEDNIRSRSRNRDIAKAPKINDVGRRYRHRTYPYFPRR